MNHFRWILLVSILVGLAACGDDSPQETPGCGDGCGPHQTCTQANLCACSPGFLDCDGSPENGCEFEGSTCPDCEPESDADLCARMGVECGSHAGEDACGAERSVDCGSCPMGSVCGLHAPHVCGEPDGPCVGETDEELCEEAGANCGEIEASDRCLDSRILDCGGCRRDWLCGPDNRCERDPEAPFRKGEACVRQGTRLGACDTGLICAGTRELSTCIPTCTNDRDCSGEEVCNEVEVEDGTDEAGHFGCQVDEFPGCDLLPGGPACLTFRSLQRCARGPEGLPVLKEIQCDPWQRCSQGPAAAKCVDLEGPCPEGHGFCTSEGNARVCANGEYEEVACDNGCAEAATGAFCRGDSLPLKTFEGAIFYEHRMPNATYSGWAVPEERPAAGLLVTSIRDGTILDQTTVASDGSFKIHVPDPPQTDDRILFYALGRILPGAGTEFRVVDPDLPAGVRTNFERGTLTIWSWSVYPKLEDRSWVIRELDGSGALQIFSTIRTGMVKNEIHYWAPNRPTQTPLEVVFHPDVKWECTACFIGWYWGAEQILLSGGENLGDASTDSLILHELGHFTMARHGIRSREGGTHCLGVPMPPGLAWSEGYATWYACEVLQNSVAYSQTRGTLFSWDIDDSGPFRRHYFFPPLPELGLLQDMNEGWVSKILWHLGKEGTSLPLWKALASPEMTLSPFGRGYVRHFWTEVDGACRAINPTPTTVSAPMLADFFDALLCDGFPSSVIGDLILPDYPFPVDEPICR